MTERSTVSAAAIREAFAYDPLTGIFAHRDSRLAKKPTAGTINKRRHGSYMALCINYKKIYAHRAAWMYVHGDIPEGLVIDHKDGNGLNNCISNLRVTTKSINQRNRRNKITEQAIAGVYPHRRGFIVYFLNKYAAWVKDYFEACCIRKSLEAHNSFLIEGTLS